MNIWNKQLKLYSFFFMKLTWIVEPITKSEKVTAFSNKNLLQVPVFKFILLRRNFCTGNPTPDSISIQYQYYTDFLNQFYFLTYMYENYNFTTQLWPSSFQFMSQNTNDPWLNEDILPMHISQSFPCNCPCGLILFRSPVGLCSDSERTPRTPAIDEADAATRPGGKPATQSFDLLLIKACRFPDKCPSVLAPGLL